MLTAPLPDRLARRDVDGPSPLAFTRAVYKSPGVVDRLRLTDILSAHSGCVNTLCWSSTGQLLLSGSDDTTLCLWRSDRNYELVTQYTTSHQANIFSARFMPACNDSVVVSCSRDGQILTFDVNRNLLAPLRTFDGAKSTVPREQGLSTKGVYTCHDQPVKRIEVEDGNPHIFFSCGEDGRIHQFDLRAPASDPNHHGYASADGSTGCRTSLVDFRQYDIRFHAISLNQRDPNYLASGGTIPLGFIHDRRMLPRPATAVRRSTSRTGQAVARFKPDGMNDDSPSVEITAVRYSNARAGELLASWHSDHIYTFDTRAAANLTLTSQPHGKTLGSSATKRGRQGLGTDAHPRLAPAPSSPPPHRIPDGPPSRRPPFRLSLILQGRNRSASLPPAPLTPSSASADPELTIDDRPSNRRPFPVLPGVRRARSSSTNAGYSPLTDTNYHIEQTLRRAAVRAFTRRLADADLRVAELLNHVRAGVRTPASTTTALPYVAAVPSPWNHCVLPARAVDHLLKALGLLRRVHAAVVPLLSRPDAQERLLRPATGGATANPLDPAAYYLVLSHLESAHDVVQTVEAALAPTQLTAYLRLLIHLLRGVWALLEPSEEDADVDLSAAQRGRACLAHLHRAYAVGPDLTRYAPPLPPDELRTAFQREADTVAAAVAASTAHGAYLPLGQVNDLFPIHAADFGVSAQAMGELRRRLDDIHPHLEVDLAGSGVTSDHYGDAGNDDDGNGLAGLLRVLLRDILPHVATLNLTATAVIRQLTRIDRVRSSDDDERRHDSGYSLTSEGSTGSDKDDRSGDEDPVTGPSDLSTTIPDATQDTVSLLRSTEWTDTDDTGLSDEGEEDDDDTARWSGDYPSIHEPHDCWSDTKILSQLRSFQGHGNVTTIKGVNYYGPNDEYVVSGSDDGNLFIWDQRTGALRQILQGDSDVVNVTQGHPTLPFLAVSGIDNTVKIFSPYRRSQPGVSFDRATDEPDDNVPAGARAGTASYAVLHGNHPLHTPLAAELRHTFPFYSESRMVDAENITEANEVHRRLSSRQLIWGPRYLYSDFDDEDGSEMELEYEWVTEALEYDEGETQSNDDIYNDEEETSEEGETVETRLLTTLLGDNWSARRERPPEVGTASANQPTPSVQTAADLLRQQQQQQVTSTRPRRSSPSEEVDGGPRLDNGHDEDDMDDL
ncbi:hypothetical protein IWQ60_011524 [Tieghemiomyces parasiticus]|uniref:Uncharacterized protein n=1 Tax=Tieghemiomyces parasiticus TaxID=78921 RepID=A0A9W7ZN18_9FUNG|nr:hypothetical protein IWQ60_011524 [Tieghemiomyces parasiticus]